ncbi:MAG: DUF3618 domain-containing protein [Solirubrobacteraceae bacterium]|jgi:hypothetical protein
MGDRSPEEIRASIEANRQALALSLDRLRGEVAEMTDWRKQLSNHRREAVFGAILAGFLAGGGLFARPRRKRG